MSSCLLKRAEVTASEALSIVKSYVFSVLPFLESSNRLIDPKPVGPFKTAILKEAEL